MCGLRKILLMGICLLFSGGVFAGGLVPLYHVLLSPADKELLAVQRANCDLLAKAGAWALDPDGPYGTYTHGVLIPGNPQEWRDPSIRPYYTCSGTGIFTSIDAPPAPRPGGEGVPGSDGRCDPRVSGDPDCPLPPVDEPPPAPSS